jgi:uncharacterized spore protein YtfJ
MEQESSGLISLFRESEQRSLAVLEKLFSAAHHSAVYSDPVQQGEYTVITACEVMVGGGFGFGRGIGPASEDQAATTTMTAGGGGSGGGGGSNARPVATIIIGPDGVQVKPVVDVTKLAITALTAWAAMASVQFGIQRARRGQ